VFQQLFEGRFSAPGPAREPRKVLFDGVLQAQPALFHESRDERFGHGLRDRPDPEARALTVRDAQLPTGPAVRSSKDHLLAALHENRAAEQLGAHLRLDQAVDLVGNSARNGEPFLRARFDCGRRLSCDAERRNARGNRHRGDEAVHEKRWTTVHHGMHLAPARPLEEDVLS
jgi:hypothetical protein